MNLLRRARYSLFPVLLGGLLLLAALPVRATDAVPQRGGDAWNLTIFHTNDTHSYFLPREATWRSGKGRMVGGVIPLAWHLEDQRRTTTEDILLDAGDFMTGNPVCVMEKDGVPGYAVAEWMNAMGYDVGVVGNHEFDIGADKTRRLVELFAFPLLGADIMDEDDHPAFRRKPVVLERDGLRIGVMGVSCSGMDEVVTATRFAGLHMAGQAEIIREQIKVLDPVTDLLVLITHNGVDGDKALAHELKGAGLDVIVGGHSHTRLTEPVLEEGVLIVQAGSKMTNLGRLDLEVADDRVVRYDGRLINLWSDGTYAGEELTELITGLENEMLDKYGRVLGEAPVTLRKGAGESNIGNWLSDSFRSYSGADVAFINSGGIRKVLPAGPVTALDIHEILPFANSLVVAELKGAQLAVIAQKNADASVGGDHGILQVSGMTYSYRKEGQRAALDEVQVGGKPLDPSRTYKVAMPDFVVMMQDVYLGLDMPPVEDLGVTLSQVVVEIVEKKGTVTAEVEGRIRLLD